MRREYIRSPTEDGMDQEALIRRVIVDVASTHLGAGHTERAVSQNAERIRETTTWHTTNFTWSVSWYQPNTHPQHAGELHVPDFDFSVNGRRLANLESKNWKPKWPLSVDQAKNKIVSRVEGRPVELGNILVISELLCETSVQFQILNILAAHHFKVILTHRKTEGISDHAMYCTLRSKLHPILDYVFTLQEPKPDWTILESDEKELL